MDLVIIKDLLARGVIGITERERERPQVEHGRRWSEEMELPLAGLSGQGVLEQRGDGALRHRIRVPRVAVAGGRRVPEDLDAIGVPASFGSWELRGSAVPLEPSGPFAGIVEATGGSAATVTPAVRDVVRCGSGA